MGLQRIEYMCAGMGRSAGQGIAFCGKIEGSQSTIYGTSYNLGRRAPRKNAEGGQETRGKRPRQSSGPREGSRQRRARAYLRRISPLGLLGGDARSPWLV